MKHVYTTQDNKFALILLESSVDAPTPYLPKFCQPIETIANECRMARVNVQTVRLTTTQKTTTIPTTTTTTTSTTTSTVQTTAGKTNESTVVEWPTSENSKSDDGQEGTNEITLTTKTTATVGTATINSKETTTTTITNGQEEITEKSILASSFSPVSQASHLLVGAKGYSDSDYYQRDEAQIGNIFASSNQSCPTAKKTIKDQICIRFVDGIGLMAQQQQIGFLECPSDQSEVRLIGISDDIPRVGD